MQLYWCACLWWVLQALSIWHCRSFEGNGRENSTTYSLLELGPSQCRVPKQKARRATLHESTARSLELRAGAQSSTAITNSSRTRHSKGESLSVAVAPACAASRIQTMKCSSLLTFSSSSFPPRNAGIELWLRGSKLPNRVSRSDLHASSSSSTTIVSITDVSSSLTACNQCHAQGPARMPAMLIHKPHDCVRFVP